MRKMFFPHKVRLAVWLGFCLLSNILSAYLALAKGEVLDTAMAGQLGANARLLPRLFLLISLSIGTSLIYNLLRWSWVQRALAALRRRLFESLLKRPWRQFLTLSEGEILAKYSQQLAQLENEFYLTLGRLSTMLIQLVVVMVALWRLHRLLAVLSFLLCSLAFLAPKLFERQVTDAANARRLSFERHAEKLQSWLSHFELLKNYRLEAIVLRQFTESGDAFRERDWQFGRLKSLSGGFGFLASLCSRSLILIFSACLVYRGDLSTGLFYSVLSLVDSLGPALYWLSKLFQDVIATRPIRESLHAFITEGETAAESSGQALPLDGPHSLEFRNVHAAFGERELFRNADLRLNTGGVYLLQGPSGCGKSSAIRLILGIDEPLEGSVLIDGVPAAQVANRRDLICSVQQEACLLQSNLRDNLTLYRRFPDEELLRVLRQVGLERLAEPACLELELSENGANLSGGEKKRLSLARGLLRSTPILILDEPLANVDPANVDKIENLILDLEGRLVLVVSHQFSPEKLARFKRIYRFEAERLIELESNRSNFANLTDLTAPRSEMGGPCHA